MSLCNDEGEIANNQCAQHRTIIAALDPPSGGRLFPLATSSSMSDKFGRWNLSVNWKTCSCFKSAVKFSNAKVIGIFDSKF